MTTIQRAGASPAPQESGNEPVPEQIADYSCVTPFEEVVAELEQWLRSCYVADSKKDAVRDDTASVRRAEFVFSFPSAAAGAEAPRGEHETERPTNCVMELFGFLTCPTPNERPSVTLLHPIAVHFGLNCFALLRTAGSSSDRIGDGSLLLSLGATAVQAAGVLVPVFASTSSDAEGLFRGVLFAASETEPFRHATDPTKPAACGFRPSSFNITRPACGEIDHSPNQLVPLVCAARLDAHKPSPTTSTASAQSRLAKALKAVPLALSTQFNVAATPLERLYHEHHGRAPPSTLEGLNEVFQFSAGATTKFASPPVDGEVKWGTACVTVNLRQYLTARAMVGEDWTAFVDDELNSQDAPLKLDPTTPRPVIFATSMREAGRSVPVGTSVCPYASINVDLHWENLDADSAAVVDNPARSHFASVTGPILAASHASYQDPQSSSSPTSNPRRAAAAVAADSSSIAPGRVGVSIVWRARSEVAATAYYTARDVASVAAAAYASGGSPDGSDDSGTPQHRDADAKAKASVFGEDMVLPTAQRLNVHASNILRPTGTDDGETDADPVAARFAHECVSLRSSEEFYLLWLRLVDHLKAVLEGSTASRLNSDDTELESLLRRSEVDRLTYLVNLIRGRSVTGGSGPRPFEGVRDKLWEKLAALAQCCGDEVERQASAQALQEKNEGWAKEDDVDLPGEGSADATDSPTSSLSLASCQSGETRRAPLDVVEGSPQKTGFEDALSRSASQSTTEVTHLWLPPAPSPLLLHPDVLATIPQPRRRAPLTRDVAERHTKTLLNYGTSATGARHRAAHQAESTSLVEDMARFIAANRGSGGNNRRVLLADFVRWYSPKDFVLPPAAVHVSLSPNDLNGEAYLANRMKEHADGNVWTASWRNAVEHVERDGAASCLPDLAYDPMAEARLILQFVGAVTQEDVGSLVAVTVVAAAARRLMSAKAWRLTLPSANGGPPTSPALPMLCGMAKKYYRATVKGIPCDTDLQSGCGSSAAWMSHFEKALAHLESLEVLTTATQAFLRTVIAHRSDAQTDAELVLMTGTADVGGVSGPSTPEVHAQRWTFVDRLLADVWCFSPWGAAEGNDNVRAVSSRADAIRRLRGLPASTMYRLQPHDLTVRAVPTELWCDWLAWRLLRPRASGFISLPPPTKAAAENRLRHAQQRRLDVGAQRVFHVHQRGCPFTANGRRLEVDSGADATLVSLAIRRAEFCGFAHRPLLQATAADDTSGSPRSGAVSSLLLTAQSLAATVDFDAQQAHFSLMTSEVIE
jgi:hypothetical protein